MDTAAAVGDHFHAQMFFNLSSYLEAHTFQCLTFIDTKIVFSGFKRGYSYFNIMGLPSIFNKMKLIDNHYLNPLFN